jgi:DNA-binding MltR family transcriptional regulator
MSKIQLEYLDKKTNKKKKTFDQITKIAKFIGRANNRTKSIGNKNTKFLLANIADKINHSKNGKIFIDHDWISTITEARCDQNLNIIKELTDIFVFERHRSTFFEGEKKYYGYIVYYTDDGIERIDNPELFYPELLNRKFQIDSRKSSVTRGRKFGYVAEEIRVQCRENSEIHARVQYNDFDTIDTKRDLGDLGGVQPQLSDKDGELQDQQNQFQDERIAEDQGVCTNTEAQVEDIATIKTAGDSKGSIPIEQSAETTSESFMGEIVRDLDLDYDYRSITVGDTQYMAPIRRVEEIKCYNFKDMALEYLAKLKAQREQDNEQRPIVNEDITLNEPEEVKPLQLQEQLVEAVQKDNNHLKESSVKTTKLRYMTIEQMREEMAKAKANKQGVVEPQVQAQIYSPKQDTAYAKTNASGIYHNKLLKDFKLTSELFDAIRAQSNKPHFSDDRITAVIQNIIANNHETRIWGGKNAFIRYMVKAVNNEKEYTEAEIGQSIADKNRQYNEELRYQFDNQIILWG